MKGAMVLAAFVVLLPPALTSAVVVKVGDRVVAQWGGNDRWYSGSVLTVSSTTACGILPDDGLTSGNEAGWTDVSPGRVYKSNDDGSNMKWCWRASTPADCPNTYTLVQSTSFQACGYTQQRCSDAALALGLTLGGGGYAFAGDYATTGCYTYNTGTYFGMAFYGYRDGGGDVYSESELTPVSSPKQRVADTYGCQAPTEAPPVSPTPPPTFAPPPSPSAPVDCKVNNWDGWSACSRTCGGGQQYRHRSLKTHASAGGKSCNDIALDEVRGCDEGACADQAPHRQSQNAHYTFGSANSNGCPYGYVNILEVSECSTAASALGLTIHHRRFISHNPDKHPKGCFAGLWRQNAHFNPTAITPSSPTDAMPICSMSNYASGGNWKVRDDSFPEVYAAGGSPNPVVPSPITPPPKTPAKEYGGARFGGVLVLLLFLVAGAGAVGFFAYTKKKGSSGSAREVHTNDTELVAHP